MERIDRFWNERDGDEVNGEVMQEVTALNGQCSVDGCKGAFGNRMEWRHMVVTVRVQVFLLLSFSLA